MRMRINPNDAVPIYHQIVGHVRDAIAAGVLKPGDKLPSQRELATQLVINHLTVKKAYETLEAQGLIHTDRGKGTFVSARGRAGLLKEGISDLSHRLEEIATTARLLGVDREGFVRRASEAFDAAERESSVGGRRK